MAKKKWDEAVIALRKIHRNELESMEVVVDLARALTYSGRREEALSVLTQAANRQKGQARAILERRARVLSRQFLTQSAQQAYHDALALLVARKFKPARDRLEKLLEQEPDNVEILLRLGQILSVDHDYDSAAERLKLARKLNPHEPQVRLWLGKALKERGELEQALEDLKYAAEKLPVSELAATWLAEALAQEGNRAQALALLEKHLGQRPDAVAAVSVLARVRLISDERDGRAFIGLRKQIEDALTQINQKRPEKRAPGLADLALEYRDDKQLRDELESLLGRVQARIAGRK